MGLVFLHGAVVFKSLAPKWAIVVQMGDGCKTGLLIQTDTATSRADLQHTYSCFQSGT